MFNLSAIEMERSLLGYIIENGTNNNFVNHYLLDEDFYDPKNRLIYKTIMHMDENNVEVEYITLINELTKYGVLDKIGGTQYIISLMKSSGLKSNVGKYALEINRFSQIRKIKRNLSEIQNTIDLKNPDVDSLLSDINEKMANISHPSSSRKFQSALQIINESIKILEEKAAGKIKSGVLSQYKILDSMTGGFQKGDLIILASRPSMGKTSLALNIAVNISRTKNVAFFSLEMPSQQLINRVLSAKSGIDSSLLRHSKNLSKSDWSKIYHSQKQIGELKLFIDDTPGVTLSELTWKATKLSQSKNKPDIIIIDYMQLIKITNMNKNSNRQAEVAAISNGLKQLARELNIPIIALAQLSRRVEQRENKVPIMSDLRESGSIEQDADIIMFLYREEYYNSQNDESAASGSELEEVDIIISKHRNGETGKFNLIFNQGLGRFASIPKSEKY